MRLFILNLLPVYKHILWPMFQRLFARLQGTSVLEKTLTLRKPRDEWTDEREIENDVFPRTQISRTIVPIIYKAPYNSDSLK